ncbi:hypothetical protein O1611_g10103 [Lasiodiplodia mahajangana]|uniref:Uncharacterized protein n=1 Tax=Lasiodiplodia mahajangana TaxID=1108764 RepID=A0ACC2J280_9PEZI|nr:hypothetical protein O1611_g10103 [Lasiodiplodia mahajangana]
MAPKNVDGELTMKEKAILGLAWKCFQTEPKIDLDKLAALGGYTNPRSAHNILTLAKKKLAASIEGAEADTAADDDGTEAVGSPKTPQAKKATATTPRGKKRAMEKDADGNDEAPTPKRARKAPAKSTPKKKVPVKDESQEVEEEVKPEIKAEVKAEEDNQNGNAGDNNAEFEI